MIKLERSFYERPTLEVAHDLLGKIFFFENNGLYAGRVVELEAYIGTDDPACHARFGPTKRNLVMFGPGGFTYVYFIYGMYDMLNFVTDKEGSPAAVLIRALEPLDGLELMIKNRGTDKIINLTNGPGKLCRAFGLTTAHSGLDLTGDTAWVADDGFKPKSVKRSRRIGIREGLDKNWRFYIDGNKFVSKV